MAPKQRMKIANEKAEKYITMRGNVPKSSVSFHLDFFVCDVEEILVFFFFVVSGWGQAEEQG